MFTLNKEEILKKIFKGLGVFVLGIITTFFIGGFFGDVGGVVCSIIYLSAVIFVSVDKLIKG